MGPPSVRRALVRALGRAGYELRRTSAQSPPRASLRGLLEQAHSAGLRPETVIDVGAAYGDWSAECAEVFPDARYVLVEPLAEFAPFLERRVSELGRASYVAAAAGRTSGETALHVQPALVGTSLRRERGPDTGAEERLARSVTVDSLVGDEDARGPYLLKVDVQGGELDVLAGAGATLGEAELVLLEVLLFEFYLGAPQLADVVAFMADAGFAAYDLFGLAYRPLDGALSQVDIAFARTEGPLRASHEYGRADQLAAETAALRAYHDRRRDAL